MQDFTIFRALGLAFKSWGRNVISITLLAGVLFAYPLYRVLSVDTDSPMAFNVALIRFARYDILVTMGLFALVSPCLTYKIVQDLNGSRVSMLTSALYGLRAIPVIIVLAILNAIAGIVPFPGNMVLQLVLSTIFFVATPAAVAERLINPFAAMSRSVTLTSGRRWGIFGLVFLFFVVMVVFVMIYMIPLMNRSEPDLAAIKHMALVMVIAFGVLQLFNGIVQAVGYALLRQDKEGITHDELAKVFE